ncbi:MAG: FAD-dependent oxidoreductase, partial [Turneriella sp.]
MLKNSDHLVIIGNGITGVSCALEVRRQADCKITLISDEGEYFFSRPALMYVFMRQMQLKDTQPYEKSFWKKKKIELKRGTVTRIESSARLLHFSDRSTISYDRLVIATGSEPNKFGWPGQNLPGVQGFYSLQDLSSLERDVADVRHAVIVGGGLIGVEVAEMLHARGIAVTFLVRER